MSFGKYCLTSFKNLGVSTERLVFDEFPPIGALQEVTIEQSAAYIEVMDGKHRPETEDKGPLTFTKIQIELRYDSSNSPSSRTNSKCFSLRKT